MFEGIGGLIKSIGGVIDCVKERLMETVEIGIWMVTGKSSIIRSCCVFGGIGELWIR